MIGAWCFVDHYGPDDVAATGGMQVPGHPHTGLQTVSWLFDGEIEHRDTTGAHLVVRPGEADVMTAGAGIAHSEFSTPTTTTLRGVQLWIALPSATRDTATPRLEHHLPPVTDVDGARVTVFVGSLADQSSPVTTYSPLLAAQVDVRGTHVVTIPVEPSFEHGLLIDSGRIETAGMTGEPGDLLVLPKRQRQVRITPRETPVRLLLLGGEPLGEQILMWWNFVGRDHDEIVAMREQWEAARTGGAVGLDRFGPFPEAWQNTLPAPQLPNGRLRPRRP